jgi:hypothetical protein
MATKNVARLEKTARSEGGMDSDHVVGDLRNQIDLGAECDYSLRMAVEPDELWLCRDNFDRERFPLRHLGRDLRLAVDQRPGGNCASA